MDQKDKLRVMLAHWVGHNKGHGEECAKWAAISKDEGLDKVAALIEEAVTTMDKTNSLLEEALAEAGGAVKTDVGHHHHH